MNTLLIKYIHDIANYGSLSRAAQVNFISVSHLSRQVKTLESQLSVTLFERSAYGMNLTKQGWDFVNWSKPVLESMENFEKRFRLGAMPKEVFSFRIAIHHNSSANQALVDLINETCGEHTYIDIIADSYNSLEDTLNAMHQFHYNIGVIQYNSDKAKQIANRLKVERLQETVVHQSPCCILISSSHPLAKKKRIRDEDLWSYARVYYVDEELSNFNDITNRSFFDFSIVQKRILIKDRGQLLQYLHSTQAYYVGTYRCPSCSELDDLVAIPLEANDRTKIITSVVYLADIRNNASVLRYIGLFRKITAEMDQEYMKLYE